MKETTRVKRIMKVWIEDYPMKSMNFNDLEDKIYLESVNLDYGDTLKIFKYSFRLLGL